MVVLLDELSELSDNHAPIYGNIYVPTNTDHPRVSMDSRLFFLRGHVSDSELTHYL